MFYVLSSWASFIKQSFSLVYYDKLTLVKSKKEPVFWEGSVPRGGTLWYNATLHKRVFMIGKG